MITKEQVYECLEKCGFKQTQDHNLYVFKRKIVGLLAVSIYIQLFEDRVELSMLNIGTIVGQIHSYKNTLYFKDFEYVTAKLIENTSPESEYSANQIQFKNIDKDSSYVICLYNI